MLAFGFEPLKKFLEKQLDRLLYHREHRQDAVLAGLAGKLATAASLDQSLQIVLHTIDEALHPRFSAVFALELGEGDALKVKRLEHTGRRTSAQLLSLIQEPVLSFFQTAREPVRTDKLIRELKKDDDRLRVISREEVRKHLRKGHSLSDEFEAKQHTAEELASRQITVSVPLHREDQLIGLLVLGERGSGERYIPHDLSLVKEISVQAATAIEKARFYDAGR